MNFDLAAASGSLFRSPQLNYCLCRRLLAEEIQTEPTLTPIDSSHMRKRVSRAVKCFSKLWRLFSKQGRSRLKLKRHFSWEKQRRCNSENEALVEQPSGQILLFDYHPLNITNRCWIDCLKALQVILQEPGRELSFYTQFVPAVYAWALNAYSIEPLRTRTPLHLNRSPIQWSTMGAS
jgi:hypothetical protein